MAATAEEIARRYMPPRYLRLDRLERFVNGTQYDGRPGFYDNRRPLLERAPNVVDPVVKNAITSNADMVFGEWRWPAITSLGGDSDSEGGTDASAASGGEASLSEDESVILDRFIARVVDQAQLKANTRQYLEWSQGVGTGAAICSVKRGRFHVEIVKAQRCTPQLDPVTGDVISMEIKYPYFIDTFDAAKNKWVRTCWVYRRVIDEDSDTEFHPVLAPKDPKETIVWRANPDASVVHALGFCPVRWYPRARVALDSGEVDGHAIHESLTDEIEAHDFSLSQRQRAGLYTGDPQQWQTGVSKKEGAPMARSAAFDPKQSALSAQTEAGWTGGLASESEPARRRGAGTILSSENPDAKFGILALSGDSLKAISDNADDLKLVIQRGMSVVEINLTAAGFARDASGKALEILYKLQTDGCNRIREDFGNRGLLPIIQMLLRLAYVVGSRDAGGLYIQGIADVMPILARFNREVANTNAGAAPTEAWFGPKLDLVWGPYFRTQMTDQAAVLNLVVLALTNGLITRKMAIVKLKAEGVFEIGDPQKLLDEIMKEQSERVSKGVDHTGNPIAADKPTATDAKVKTPTNSSVGGANAAA